MLFDQSAGHLLGTRSRVQVADGRENYGALHQDLPGRSEFFDVGQPRGQRSVENDVADAVDVRDAGLPGRMIEPQLEQHVDKRAAFVPAAGVKPVVQYVKDRQQLPFGGGAALP